MRQAFPVHTGVSCDGSSRSPRPAYHPRSMLPGPTDAPPPCVTRYPFSGLEVTAISHDARGMSPGGHLILPGGNRDYTLVLQLEGCGSVAQGGDEVRLETGDIMLINAASATLCRLFDWSRQLCIQLPRASLQARLATAAVPTTCLIKGSGGLSVVLRSLIVSSAGAAGTLSRREERGIREALVDLAVAALCAERQQPLELRVFRPAAARHWALLRQSIEALLSDPALSPAKLAEAHNISTRHLHRLFKHAGTSFGEYVRARRLARCRNDLADQRLAALPVTEIAFRWGFSDSSHFSRCFKATFGCTARDFRAACWSAAQLTPCGDASTTTSFGV
jgi:AraC family transcriptional regulator, positive regulator of tynA and feaB